MGGNKTRVFTRIVVVEFLLLALIASISSAENGLTTSASTSLCYSETNSPLPFLVPRPPIKCKIDANNRHPFLLKDGTGFTPTNIEELLDNIIEIQHINSIAFLLWIEELAFTVRTDILSAVANIPITEESTHLVKNLIHHVALTEKLEYTKNLTQSLYTGDFINQLAEFSEHDVTRVAISKSIVLNAFAKFKDQISIDFTPEMNYFLYNLRDLINAFKSGNLEGGLIASMLLFGQLLDTINGTKFATMLGSAGKMMFKYGGSYFSVIVSIYGVVSDINALKDGNLNGLGTAIAITSLINNVVAIVLTLVGLAFPIVGQIGMVIAVLVGVVLQLLKMINDDNMADAFVMQLGTYITLTEEEKKREKDNRLKGDDVDRALEALTNKAMINLSLVGNYITFLRDHPSFEKVIVPAIEGLDANDKPIFYKNNKADLRAQSEFYAERWGPQLMIMNEEGYFKERVCCTPSHTEGEILPQDFVRNYKCEYAIGIIDTYQRNDTLTLFLLQDGDDEAYGTTNDENIFMTEAGKKDFTGGNENDMFFIQSDKMTGFLRGGNGNDTLALMGENITTTSTVRVDLDQKRLTFPSGHTIQIEGIEAVIGRELQPETIIPTYTTMLIDGMGGSDAIPDHINVPPLGQSFDLNININVSTRIYNEGKYGMFYYSIPESLLEANAKIQIQDGVESKHFILMESPITDIRKISLDEDICDMTVESEFGTTVVTSFVSLNVTTGYYEPTIVFPSDVVVKVNDQKIVTVLFTITIPNPKGILPAPPYGQTHFLLSTTYGHLRGGAGDDLFLLGEDSYLKLMNGQGGTNRLILNETFYPASIVVFDMSADPQLLSYDNKETETLNIQQFLGRKGGIEHITVGCGETFVDGQGGGAGVGNEDQIIILTADCDDRTALIRIRNDTIVQNTAIDGNFVYFISFLKNFQLDFDFRENLNHTFQFDTNITCIKNATIDLEARTVEFESMTPDEPKLRIALSSLDSLDDSDGNLFFTQPTFITNDIVFLKAGKDGVMSAIFSLNDTKGPILGSTFGPNIFLIKGDVEHISGGEFVDMFILQNGTRVEFDGGLGKDRLIIDENYEEGLTILIDFRYGHITSDDGDLDTFEIHFDSIEEFIGRNGSADHIIADCILGSIDGLGGGGPDELDIIDIVSTESDCRYNLVVIVREHQEIIFGELNRADNLTFFIQTSEGGSFDFTEAAAANQVVILPFDHDKFNIHFSNDTSEISFESDQALTFKLFRNESAKNEAFHLSPRIFSKNFVEFKVNNMGEITAIFQANDNRTTGFDVFNNIFLVSGGENEFETVVVGGDGTNDTFIYANVSAYGELIGNRGFNTLRISDELKESIEIEPISPDNENHMMRYQNITYIFGRNVSQDIITVDCDVALIISNGGNDSSLQDEIIIPDLNCFYDLNLVINKFTTVRNRAQNGSFFYTLLGEDDEENAILAKSGRFEIFCTNCTSYNYTTTHTIALNYPSGIVSHFSTDDDTCELHLHTTEQTIRTFALTDADPCEYPRLLFLDGFQLDTSHMGIFRMNYKSNDSNVEQIIEEFQLLATKWNSSIMVITKDERLVSIGAPGLDLLQNNPETESHLIGNGGENIYILNKINSSQVLANTYLYLNGNGTDYVDLNQLVQPIRERAEIDNTTFLYVPEVFVDDDDVLHVLVSDEDILLSETVFYNWRESHDIQFIIGSSFMVLNNTEANVYILSPIPFNLTTEEFAIMDQVDFEDGMIIRVSKTLRSGKNTFTRSGDDLVVTNTLNMTTDTDGAFTMIFKSGADMRMRGQRMNLPKGVSVQFEDTVVDLDTILDDISVLVPVDEAQEAIREEVENEAYEFQCKSEGLQSHPRQCNKYYRCINVNGKLTPFELPCPGDSIFCEDSLQCDIESSSCQCTPYLGYSAVLWS